MSSPVARFTVFVVLGMLLGTVSSSAEEFECDRSKSLKDCYDQALGALMSDAQVEANVEDKASPAPKIGGGGNGSLVDFLPSFLASLGVDGLSETDGNLNFDRVVALSDNWRIVLGATAFLEPDIFEPLRQALPEEVREDRSTTLKEGVGDFDKVDLRLLLTKEDSKGERRFGRDVKDYGDLVSAWRDQMVKTAVDDSGGTPFNNWIRQLDVSQAEDDYGPGFLSASLDDLADAGKLGEERAKRLGQGIAQVATDMSKFTSGVGAAIGQIDDMIANQPQIYLELQYFERDELTGPDEISGRFCYEMGMSGNINDFISWAKKHPAKCPVATGAYPSFDCLTKYLTQKPKASEHSNRLAVAIEYSDADPYMFSLPEDSFSFQLEATEKWVGSLTYGRYFPNFRLMEFRQTEAASKNEDGTRFDLEAKYEDVTGDPMRQSRFVATATLSQRISKSTLLSLSAVYANKPEYLGEVDEEVSARFGFKWKTERNGS